jgi:hypothetical protein
MNSNPAMETGTDLIISEDIFQRLLVLDRKKTERSDRPFISGRRRIAQGEKQATGNSFGQPCRGPWLIYA